MTPKSKEYVEDSDTDSEPEQDEVARSKPKPPSPIAKRKSNTTFNSPPKKVKYILAACVQNFWRYT